MPSLALLGAHHIFHISRIRVNRDVGSMKDKKQKVVLKDMRTSIPDATALYLFHQKYGFSLHPFLPLGL